MSREIVLAAHAYTYPFSPNISQRLDLLHPCDGSSHFSCLKMRFFKPVKATFPPRLHMLLTGQFVPYPDYQNSKGDSYGAIYQPSAIIIQ